MPGIAALFAFAETAQQGSFAAAARELGLSASAVAKAVARLESDLGLRLFHRTTRQVTLSADGQALFARCQRVLAELEALNADAAGVLAEPSGTLRIDAPVVWGRHMLLPVVAHMAARYSKLSFDLSFSDRFIDVVRERVDAAVRVGELSDSSLVARRVGWQQLVIVASPAYLQAHGEPRAPAELAAHQCIVFRNPSAGRHRPWQFSKAKEWLPPSRLVLNDGEAIVAAAVAGMGLAQVPDHMASEAIAAGRLFELLPRHQPKPLPISVIYPSKRQAPPRLEVFIEALVAHAQASGSHKRG